MKPERIGAVNQDLAPLAPLPFAAPRVRLAETSKMT